MRHQLTNFTDAEIAKAMRPYSYGEGIERTTDQLVYTMAHGLLQITAGFRTGGTMAMILRDMGLITTRRGYITAKGRRFMYDCFSDSQTVYEPKTQTKQAPADGPLPQVDGNTGLPCQVKAGGQL